MLFCLVRSDVDFASAYGVFPGFAGGAACKEL